MKGLCDRPCAGAKGKPLIRCWKDAILEYRILVDLRLSVIGGYPKHFTRLRIHNNQGVYKPSIRLMIITVGHIAGSAFSNLVNAFLRSIRPVHMQDVKSHKRGCKHMHLSTRFRCFRQSPSLLTGVAHGAFRVPGDATFAKGRKPYMAHNRHTVVLAHAFHTRDDATPAQP